MPDSIMFMRQAELSVQLSGHWLAATCQNECICSPVHESFYGKIRNQNGNKNPRPFRNRLRATFLLNACCQQNH